MDVASPKVIGAGLAAIGAGLADAYGAVTADVAPVAAAGRRPVERASTGAR